MDALGQVAAVTLMNLRAIPARLGAAAVPMIAAAVVVAVLIALLAMGEGILGMVARNAHPDHAIVMSSGAADQIMSSIGREQVAMIANAPGIRHGADGRPLIQPEAAVIVEVHNKKDGSPANIMFLGSGQMRWALAPEVRIVQGRMFKPAVRELIAGRSASREFRGLSVGDKITFRGSEWTVVGQYEANGGLVENGIIGDAETVMSAFDRNAFQSVAVGLVAPGALERFKDALESNPSLHVQVVRETDYLARQIKPVTALLDFVAYFVGGVMAIAATFAIMNAIYTSVDARAKELATLRALGFGGLSVVVSVLAEALMLAIPGAAVGAAIAWGVFNGRVIDAIGVPFSMVVTPKLVLIGLIWAAVMGLAAGFLPALRAATGPVVTALRSA